MIMVRDNRGAPRGVGPQARLPSTCRAVRAARTVRAARAPSRSAPAACSRGAEPSWRNPAQAKIRAGAFNAPARPPRQPPRAPPKASVRVTTRTSYRNIYCEVRVRGCTAASSRSFSAASSATSSCATLAAQHICDWIFRLAYLLRQSISIGLLSPRS